MIKPTVGRVVWFWPGTAYARDRGMAYSNSAQPLAAQITYVHSDQMVNLVVFDQKGVTFGVTSVELLQGDRRPPLGMYCEWMPYQKGQAAKTEALEAKVDTQLFGQVGAPDSLTQLLHAITESGQPAHPIPAGPSLTMGDIQAAIVDEAYQVLTGTLVTTCCLTLRNGAKVVGVNYGPVSPQNFSAKDGRKYARENAIEQIWPLEGYLLRQRLYEQEQDAEQMLVAEVEAGQAAAEALIDHLEAMGDPASVEIPISRNGRSFKVKVLAE